MRPTTMRPERLAVILALIGLAGQARALEPNEILLIANKDCPDSVEIAQYYCRRRNVPAENILHLALGRKAVGGISRDDYNRLIALPVRNDLLYRLRPPGVRCLLTTYGVPYKVYDIEDNQTHASLDSDLAMVLFDEYELYRWQPNLLKQGTSGPPDLKTLMVCRLDGPGADIAKGLVDKAIRAEQGGLKGAAYIDSRGIHEDDAYGHYDQSLRDLAVWIRGHGHMPVRLEQTPALFGPGDCPNTAIYCGWYSLKKYVDAFDFADGAIGFHIASFEAVDLRDPDSTQWCPALLRRGIAATLGPVAEPYLNAFPEPAAFFKELFEGRCLVEAFFRTNPFNSWQMVLIGDPLYRPFKS